MARDGYVPMACGNCLFAYSTLSIAAIHALVMYVQDKHLHRMRANAQQTGLGRALDRLFILLENGIFTVYPVTVIHFVDTDGVCLASSFQNMLGGLC